MYINDWRVNIKMTIKQLLEYSRQFNSRIKRFQRSIQQSQQIIFDYKFDDGNTKTVLVEPFVLGTINGEVIQRCNYVSNVETQEISRIIQSEPVNKVFDFNLDNIRKIRVLNTNYMTWKKKIEIKKSDFDNILYVHNSVILENIQNKKININTFIKENLKNIIKKFIGGNL